MFQSQTLFDLLVEYQLDIIENNPLEAHRTDDGHIQFKNTGDDLIDRWEQQIADGFQPDLEEAFKPGELDKIRGKLKRAKQATAGGPTTFGEVAEAVMDRGVPNKNTDPFNVFGS